jgi:hypothetical protein
VNRGHLAARALAIGGLLAIVGCSFSQYRVLDRAEVESKVKTELEAAVGAEARSVSCPDDLKAEVDATTRCSLQAMDGTEFGVTVTVTSVDGDDVNFDAQVDQTPRQ